MKNDVNLVLTCKFSAFAEAYTGTFDSEEIFEQAKEGIFVVQQNIKNGNRPISNKELSDCWDEYVEIRAKKLPNGNFELSLTVALIGGEYNFSCDVHDLKQFMDVIIDKAIMEAKLPAD